MVILNEYNENTKKDMHIMITSLCARNCPYCCNNQYSLDIIPYATDFEFKNAERLFLTGGEPFAFGAPCEIAEYYKNKYPNIKGVYVYTNAFELYQYLNKNSIHHIDGLTISIKNEKDKKVFLEHIINNKDIINLNSNIVYVFDNLIEKDIQIKNFNNFIFKNRVWQKDFVPDANSIFRKI